MLRNVSAMTAERDVLRLGNENFTVLFQTKVSSFDFQVESTDGPAPVQTYCAVSASLHFHRDVNDTHRADANPPKNKSCPSSCPSTSYSDDVADKFLVHSLMRTLAPDRL